ncbi:glycosyltransferase family 4 protein [Haloferax volcanii]|uniref:glycosyltransferase family 4 protein n=1 Tax=Haloferax volcanii TaxID=2246 RepID=UPI0038550AD0
MKIGINARTFNVDEPDGAVQSARKITKSLSKAVNGDVILFGDADLESDPQLPDTVYSSCFWSSSPFFGALWERVILPHLVNKSDVDVLLCPNGNAPPLGVNCPIITYVHDVNAQKEMSGTIHGLYRKYLMPLGIRNSKAIVTVSNFSKQEISRELGVREEKIHVVYNGVDEFYMQDSGSEAFDLPEEYFLYVGAMNPRKNVQGLIESYNLVKDDVPHDLVLIGPNNKSVYKKFELADLSERIHTPGYLPQSQLKYAYENADLFLFPSLYEGFGLPPLEAMACGTPVISSNRSALPEILGENAILIDPKSPNEIANAILQSVNDSDSPHEKLLKKQASKFTWEQAATQLLRVVSRVDESHQPRN